MTQIIMTKCLLVAWFLLGGYFIVAAHGVGGSGYAVMAMLCGFMAARVMADMV